MLSGRPEPRPVFFAAVVLAAGAAGVASAGASASTDPGAGTSPLPASGPAPEATCAVSYRSPPGPREPHPPVRIDGDDLNEQPRLVPADRPGPAAYRPGSGIVAGNGTEANPYLVAGWRLARVTIQDTDAHVVVADNKFNPLLEPTGRAVDPDPGPAILPRATDSTPRGVSRIEAAPNVTFLDNVGRGEVKVARSPGFCYGDNGIVSWTPDRTLRVCRSDGARVVGNEIYGLDLRRSAHVRIADNSFHDRGIDLRAGANCRDHFTDPVPDVAPEHFDHDIPPTNTLDGEPIRYVHEEENVTLEGPLGQVLVHDARNVTVRGASLAKTDIAYARDVALRNVTVGDWKATQILETPGFTLADSSLGRAPIAIEASPNTTLIDNKGIPLGVSLMDSNGSRVAGNNLSRGNSDYVIRVEASQNVSVQNNSIPLSSKRMVAIYATDVKDAQIVGNTVGGEYAYEGITAFGRNVTVTDNRIWADLGGIAAGLRGNSTIAHNSIDEAVGDGYTGIVAWPGTAEAYRLEDNLIRNASQAIVVHEAGNVASLEGNNFGVGVGTGVELDEGGPLDATGNWWGCPEGPPAEDCAGVEGDVVVDPVLTEPNPDAGPRW